MTDYVMLECNRLRGRQSYNPFNEKTDEYKNRWVNNVSSYGITINKGDIIILFEGGHGFKILEKSKIIEVKQGPYVEGKDKKIIETKIA